MRVCKKVREVLAEVVENRGLRNQVHVFEDRFHAGSLLVEKLIEYEGENNVYVLAIPAGGVEVAYTVAKGLHLPLDVAVTRKLHVPWNPEAGFGAVSWVGQVFLNEPMVQALGLTEEDIERCVDEEKEVIRRRLQLFRGDKPSPDLRNKVVVVVDDGLASGYSMFTTLKALKPMGVKEMVVAVPTAPMRAIQLVRSHANRIICLNVRTGPIFAVADAYRVWYDLKDADVVRILKKPDLFKQNLSNY
jgi:putative phosphoribosyl transferase